MIINYLYKLVYTLKVSWKGILSFYIFNILKEVYNFNYFNSKKLIVTRRINSKNMFKFNYIREYASDTSSSNSEGLYNKLNNFKISKDIDKIDIAEFITNKYFLNQLDQGILNKLNELFRDFLFIFITIKYIISKEVLIFYLSNIRNILLKLQIDLENIELIIDYLKEYMNTES